jgi:hypothetical protein
MLVTQTPKQVLKSELLALNSPRAVVVAAAAGPLKPPPPRQQFPRHLLTVEPKKKTIQKANLAQSQRLGRRQPTRQRLQSANPRRARAEAVSRAITAIRVIEAAMGVVANEALVAGIGNNLRSPICCVKARRF